LLVVLLVLVTGGGTFDVASIHSRLRSVDNPIWELTALMALRFALRMQSPFLGLPRFGLSEIDRQSLAAARSALRSLGAAAPHRSILATCIVALVVKLTAAWCLPGFFSGDDVEIHEMTFAALFGNRWPVWELRSPFFPMTFIFPAQRLALALGAGSPEQLVFAGRVVVALLSTAVVPLTWVAARRFASESSGVPLLATLLVAVNKLQMSFGSSELPRPVSAVFVLAAFVVLTRPAPRVLLGGGLLGCATAFRFSEAVFVVPAVLVFATSSHWRLVPAVIAGWAAAAGLILGISDYLYWGSPFFSLAHAVDYTLLKRLSSRGYEPVYQYLILVPTWSNWTIVALAIIGSWRRRLLLTWTWLPLAVLSCLPHKESRYLIPIIPFVMIASALGIQRIMQAASAPDASRWAAVAGGFLTPLVLVASFQDAGGWRLARSNEEVRLARFLNARGGGGLAVEQSWRLGGRPYLSGHEPLVDIGDARLKDAVSRYNAFKDVRWIALKEATASRLDVLEMRSLGFERDLAWKGQAYSLFTCHSP
jgi:hypothetical protein